LTHYVLFKHVTCQVWSNVDMVHQETQFKEILNL